MQFPLPANSLYGNEPVIIDLPDGWNVRVCSYKGAVAPKMTQQQLRSVVYGTDIAGKAKGCRDAVIIIDDTTRPTPCGQLAGIIIEELVKAGIPENKIRFVGATGMHRAMAREDFVRKLGEEIVSNFATYSHNPFFNNVMVGICFNGMPIELNAECVNADFKIGIGSLFGHPNTGVAGGGKLIVPGIASSETIRRYHLTPREKWNQNLDARRITVEASELLNLNVKFDALLNGAGEIAQLYAGSCRENLEKNFEDIFDFFSADCPEPADVVIANNYFKPSEANVVLNYPEFFELIKPGGDLIVAANSPMGAATHYLFGKWGDSGIGGLAYYGDSAVPERVGRYFAFSEHLDRGTAQQYHYDAKDPRFRWSNRWSEIVAAIGEGPKDVLILPYAGVPFFKPAIDVGSVPTLFIGGSAFLEV